MRRKIKGPEGLTTSLWGGPRPRPPPLKFGEVDGGLEGLVHVSEMSWVSKIQKPENYVSIGDELEVMVLEIDTDKKRLSLGIKQCVDNPWENFAQKNPSI